jgi:replicative DNA helicase
MSPEEIAIRVAQRFGLNTFRFYKGESNQRDREVAEEARAHQAHRLVRIAYTRKLAGIERLIEQEQPDLLIVDYLQFLEIGKGTRLEGTTRNSQALKDIARKCKLPVLCLSQLRRADRTNRDAEPELDDLRDSGSIEQDGDHVIFVWRKEIVPMYDTATGQNYNVHKGNFIVRKARMGELGKVGFAFNPYRQTFEQLAEAVQ